DPRRRRAHSGAPPLEAPAPAAAGPPVLSLGRQLGMIPQPLVESRTLGRLRIHAIQAGGQKLDGGAMFGVVPKTLWEKRIPADERNRIQLGMRCLLIEHDVGLVLIDSGAGNKEDPKFYDIYGIENAGSPTRLEDGIRAAGFEPSDVSLVINSHLHFDHAG